MRATEPVRGGLRSYSLTLLSWLLAIALWQFLSMLKLVNPVLFPGPVAVVRAFVAWAKEGTLLPDLAASLQESGIGWSVGGSIGVVLGLLSGRLLWGSITFGRIINTLRAVPPVALVPTCNSWFGISESSKIFLIAWGSFFPVWLSTHLGVSNVNRSIEWAARSLGAHGSRLMLQVVLPAAIPSIFAGLRVAIGIAYICVFVGELAGAYAGLGFRIATANLVFRSDLMVAGLVVLGVLGAASDALFSLVASRVFPWLRDVR